MIYEFNSNNIELKLCIEIMTSAEINIALKSCLGTMTIYIYAQKPTVNVIYNWMYLKLTDTIFLLHQ